MNKWHKLQKVFQAISSMDEGLHKTTSGSINVIFGSYDYITVSLGGYEVPSWSRHEFVGEFKTEEDAFEKTVKKIKTGLIEIIKDNEFKLKDIEVLPLVMEFITEHKMEIK